MYKLLAKLGTIIHCNARGTNTFVDYKWICAFFHYLKNTQFIHLIHMYNTYLLCVSWMPGIVLDVDYTVVNQTDMVPVLNGV